VKDRLFWFGDYEGLREREGSAQARVVPSALEKAGFFTSPVLDPFAPGKPEFGRNASGLWVISQDRWDPVAANIVKLIPDPNVPGTNIYASTPIVRTRSDQFDLRIDYHVSSATQLFGRYSFVDSNIFRPAPLPGFAEGSYSDAFGSNHNRSQGLVIGFTHTFSNSFSGDVRIGWNRGDYFSSPPNARIDAPALVGLKNAPNDPGILGGLPKIGLQGYDAIGRHTSTPQFQTPRTWNPRTTSSLQLRSESRQRPGCASEPHGQSGVAVVAENAWAVVQHGCVCHIESRTAHLEMRESGSCADPVSQISISRLRRTSASMRIATFNFEPSCSMRSIARILVRRISGGKPRRSDRFSRRRTPGSFNSD